MDPGFTSARILYPRCFTELSATALRLLLKRKSVLLKGTLPRDFRLQAFFKNQFPPSPCTIRAVSNLFENSQRYSQLKLHHRVAPLVANEKNLLLEKF